MMDEDWGESASSTGFGNSMNSSAAGRGRGGFGRGGSNMSTEQGHWGEPPNDEAPVVNRLRGFGRGRMLKGRMPAGDGGSSSGGGFGGSKPGGGFSRGDNEKTGFGGGFSKSRDDENNNGGGGGFSSKPSFGQGRGFGSRSNDNSDEPRGGGFGGSRNFDRGDGARNGGFKSSGSGCHKCGEEGHFARECPQAGGDAGRGGGRGCHKCGEEGHFARECPKGGSGGGSGRGACYKCNEEGHMARDCPNSDAGGGGSRPSRGCYKCGQDGHISRDCPNEGSSTRSGGFGGGRSSGGFGGDDKTSGDGERKPPAEIYVPPAPPETEEEMFANRFQQGLNFDSYDKIPSKCTGNNAPADGIKSFQEADIHEVIQENIKRARYEKPTPVQKWAIPIILDGRDLMSCAQTGSGKTAAFLLPVLSMIIKEGLASSEYSEKQEPQALIIGPTRELVTQIYQEARKFANKTMLKPVVVYGGTSVGHQLRQVESGTNLLIGTPGRLTDFLDRGKISLAKLKFLILDEADRMLDMGFKPAVQKIVESYDMPSKTARQTLMFSATFPEEVQKLAADFLNNYLFVTIGIIGGASELITQTVYQVSHHDKREKLCEILRNSGNDRVLVFVEQKRNADFLASFLSQSDFPTTSIHGDRLQREREEALRDFKKGSAPVMVATSVAARGLDIPDVMHVINYDMPSDISEYVHRIGRTGRCGHNGKATTFFNPENDGQIARALVKTLQEAQQEVPSWLEEAAQNAFGAGGFTGVGGTFGSRDTRRGNFGSNNDQGSSFASNGFGGSSMGGGGGGVAAAEEEESWD